MIKNNLIFFSVCESVLQRLRDKLPSDASAEEIEIEFKEFCKKATGKDERFVSDTDDLSLYLFQVLLDHFPLTLSLSYSFSVTISVV